MLLRITADHLCAGAVTDGRNYVTLTAPILHYMRGWDEYAVWAYCKKKRWKLEVLGDPWHKMSD